MALPEKKVIAFGEIMMRLSPPGFQRFVQARSLDVVYGGAEANLAVSLAGFGMPVDYVTRLPDSSLGDACFAFLRQYGVGVSRIVRGGDKLGIYFLEVGAGQRGSKVVYDRAGSSLAEISPGMVDWRAVFSDASWFHWTGITPAVSEGAADTCLEALQIAHEMGLTVSCDMNYRSNLWQWGKPPSEVMPELIEQCDIVIGVGREEVVTMLGLDDRHLEPEGVRCRHQVCELAAERYPGLKIMAGTIRRSVSASHGILSGTLWDRENTYTSGEYDITETVDRIGGGDAFAAGLLYGMLNHPEDRQRIVDFAVAASCLKHSVFGDFNLVSVDEVERLMAGDNPGRVSR